MARNVHRRLQERAVTVGNQTDRGADQIAHRGIVAAFQNRDTFGRILHHFIDGVDVGPGVNRVDRLVRVQHRQVSLSVLNERHIGDRGVRGQQIYGDPLFREIPKRFAHDQRKEHC